MSTYRINYKQLRQSPELAQMLEALQRGFTRFGVDFYLIGAVARDVWMQGINDILPKRTTGDIGFAVLINREGSYEQLRDYLLTHEDFHPSRENTFVLIWQNGQEVDLMPFGRIEKNSRIKVQGTGLTTQHVAGFKEVYEAGLPELELEDRNRFKFCTIPGIVLLKLIAWNDRPENRSSDIQDISDILLHYFEMFTEEIYESHNDLFEDEEDDAYFIKIAAQVVGREMGKIAWKNEALQSLLLKILQDNTASAASSRIAAIMANTLRNTVENNLALLMKMKQGMEEYTAS